MTRDLAVTMQMTLLVLSALCIVTSALTDDMPALGVATVLTALAGVIEYVQRRSEGPDGAIECAECGHDFAPDESPSDEVCVSCLEFLGRYYGEAAGGELA